MTIIVKIRRIYGNPTERTVATFAADQRAEADKMALQINCKAFTPFFAWVEG